MASKREGKATEQDPTAGWSDEKIVREFIEFAARSADDGGPTPDMADQALRSLKRLADGIGATDADSRLVEAMAVVRQASLNVQGIGVKTGREEMRQAVITLTEATEALREELDIAAPFARAKLKQDINSTKDRAREAFERLAAHQFR